jgi:hypothetical protein
MNRRTFLALVAFLLAPACPGTAQEPKPLPAPTFRVEPSPRIQIAQLGKPSSVLIRVRGPENRQNRFLCVAVDGPVFRSSCWETLQGEALSKEFRYSSLTAGEYDVIGELTWVEEATGERKKAVVRDRFVIRMGGEPSEEF